MIKSNTTSDSAFTVSAFVDFMTLFGAAQQILKDRMQEDAELGLGPVHMRALCLCLKNPQGTQQQLVQAMGKDKGQIARLTRDLEKLGLLVRTPDAQDGRVWRLSVTPDGAQKCAWFFAIETELAQELFGKFAKAERIQLEHILELLHQRMGQLMSGL